MKEFKGTQGEWEVDGIANDFSEGVYTSDIDGDIICFAPENFGPSMVKWEANAKLIASAPDMLKALITARFDLKSLGAKENAPMINSIDKAINKALGND